MLATSWKATGLVRPVWQRLEVKTYKREELARLAGIPVSNLSSLNTGKLPMTMEMAEKIARAVPGVTVLDLGAPLEALESRDPSALDRLERLEDTLERVLSALDDAGIALPGAPEEDQSSPNGPRFQPQKDG